MGWQPTPMLTTRIEVGLPVPQRHSPSILHSNCQDKPMVTFDCESSTATCEQEYWQPRVRGNLPISTSDDYWADGTKVI